MHCPRCDTEDAERDFEPEFGCFWTCNNCGLDFQEASRKAGRGKESWYEKDGYYYRPDV